MTLAQKKALEGRVDSQMLLGDRVVVDSTSGDWAHVTVPDQPNPADARGYPGWVPLAQLTFSASDMSGPVATVVARTTWLLDHHRRACRRKRSLVNKAQPRRHAPAGS